jgi:glycosyltransferase A (GT-A) superfamily protein (DUF2064 family)
MTLGDYPRAKEQFLYLLKNNYILTDFGTYLMIRYHKTQSIKFLYSAIEMFTKSYRIDKKNQNRTSKLSAAYYFKNDGDKLGSIMTNASHLAVDPSRTIILTR